MTRNNLQTNPAVEEAGLCIANFLENNDRLANLLQNIDYPRLLKINEDLELGLKMRKANLKCMPIQQEPMTEIIKNIERELNYRFITFEEVCRVINEFDIVLCVPSAYFIKSNKKFQRFLMIGSLCQSLFG